MNLALLTLIFTKAFTIFLMLDPPGNVGIIAPLLQRYSPKRQSQILRREMSIALVVMLCFYFGGSLLLGILDISQAAVEMTGGIILFFFSLSLLFPHDSPITVVSAKSEPFIVPIAVPLVAGPSALATIMLLSHENISVWVALAAIFCAWLCATVIILASPLLIRIIGKVGIAVTEQLMGLLCALIATQMFFNGLTSFLSNQ